MYISKTDAERYGYETYAEKAEKLNDALLCLDLLLLLSAMLLAVVYFSLVSSASDD